MGSLRLYYNTTQKEEAIDIFNSYKIKNRNNINHTLVQLSNNGYNEKYFRKGFLTYIEFIDFFKIDLLDFESAGWDKWSHPDIKKTEFSQRRISRECERTSNLHHTVTYV